MSRYDTRSNLQISGFKNTPMKVYAEPIDAGNDERIGVIYEAYNDTKNGQDCRATVYIYNGSSDNVLYTFEKPAKWNGQWDTDNQQIAIDNGYWKVNGEA